MIGLNYPVADYYREHIKDGVTLTRSGQWWSAVLLIQDPRSSQMFIKLYLWERTGEQWKMRKSFSIKSRQNLRQLQDALANFGEKLP